MSLVGFNFTKISGEVQNAPKGKYSITPNIGLRNVTVQDFALSKDDSKKVINVKFGVSYTYSPDIAQIVLEGELMYLIPSELAATVEADFKEKKSLPQAILTKVMSTIFTRGQVQAIITAKDLNLPSPVQLPKLSVEKKDKVADKKE